MRYGKPINQVSDFVPRLAEYGRGTINRVRQSIANRYKRRQQNRAQPKKKAMKQPSTSTKLRIANVMWTYAYYHMHPVIRSVYEGGYYAKFEDGRGPSLNSILNVDPTSKQFNNISGTSVTDSVAQTNFHDNIALVPKHMFTYVFAADYPFNTMLPICQKTGILKDNMYLAWDTVVPKVTTDPNLPITLSDVVANKDWNKITHNITYLYFDFTNYAQCSMIVEVLLFRYVVDVDAMSYTQLIDAPLSRQYDEAYTSYCEMKNMSLGTKQIRVVKRIRFKMQNRWMPSPTHRTADTETLRNLNYAIVPKYRKLKLRVKRNYTIKRPIAKDYEVGLADSEFFNTYYEYDKGVYCRIQAWPEDTKFDFTRKEVVPATDPVTHYASLFINKSVNQSCEYKQDGAETPTATDYRIAEGVACYLEKKSFFKLDEPMLKGPFRS